MDRLPKLTFQFKSTLNKRKKELIQIHNEIRNRKRRSAKKTILRVVGIDGDTYKTLGVILFLLVLSFSFPISNGIIYKGCGNRTSEGSPVNLGDKTTVYFAVILAATEKKDSSKKCEVMNWRNLRNLLAIQWIVDKLNTPDENNQTFMLGYNIDFRVFDDCGQPEIVFKHTTDILEPSLTTQFNECPSIPQKTQLPFFAILTLGNASVTEAILEVSKTTPIPVVNPKMNLDSFQRYSNFVSFSSSFEFNAQAILNLLKKLKWMYTAIIYSNTEFDRKMKDHLMSGAINYSICFAFNENTSNIDRIEMQIKITKKRTKNQQLGIVYLGDGSDMNAIFENNNPEINWIIFDSFGGHFKTLQAFPNNRLRGALTLYPADVYVEDFETFYVEKTKSLLNTSEPVDHWINDLLYRTNQQLRNIPSVDVLTDDVPSVMDAVYVLATAKKDICNKPSVNCIQSNLPYLEIKTTVVNYAKIANFSPRKFWERRRIITVLNNTVKTRRSSETVFNVLNLWNGDFKKVGTFNQNYQLTVSLNEIKMTDKNDNAVTGSNLPKSLCSKVCEECQQPEFKDIIAYIPGDILLLGIFSVHDTGPSFHCGKFRKLSTDAIASESFLYTIQRLRNIFPNITLGGIAIDDCYNVIQTGKNITMILSGEKKLTDPSTGEIIDPQKIVAVIGPLTSGVTKVVVELLTQEKILSISYGASSHDLDDRISYPYFLRTVPSDILQVNAIIALLEQLKWKYVGMIYCNNNYGLKAKEVFLAAAQKKQICVSPPKMIEESSMKAELYEVVNILDSLMEDQVKIVVYFGTNSRLNDLTQALKKKNLQNIFVFIGSETWGVTNISDLQTVAGSLTLTLDSSKTADVGQFKEYLAKRTLKSSMFENPFFNMFWYNFHQCNPPDGFRNIYDRACTGSERFTDEKVKAFSKDQRTVQTMNALHAVYEGIKIFQRTQCTHFKKVPCDRFFTHIREFVSTVKGVKLKGYDDDFSVFDQDGNGKISFNIHNIQRKESQYVYQMVGSYNAEYSPALRMSKLHFYNRRLQPISYVNVTCVTPYKCCDLEKKPEASSVLEQTTSLRTVDIVIISILCFLLVLIILLVSFYLLHRKQKGNERKSSLESSVILRKTNTENELIPNDITTKRPPTVYVRSEEPLHDESENGGVVTYQIVNNHQDSINKMSSVFSPTPSHTNPSNIFNNPCFQSDNVFYFPETDSQSVSTSYEEIASPNTRKNTDILPRRFNTEIKKQSKDTNIRCYSDGDRSKRSLSQNDTFII